MIICCTVGMLLGDAWMCMPALRDVCEDNEVGLVCGSYALPAWEWARDNVVGCNYRIVKVIDDPDVSTHPYCPGCGTYSMDRALFDVRPQYAAHPVWGYAELGNYYANDPWKRVNERNPRFCGNPNVRLMHRPTDREHVVIHAYTRHDWKNCNLVVQKVAYSSPVIAVGLPDESLKTDLRLASTMDVDRFGYTYCSDFAAICAYIIACKGFVGVLSAWTNFAAIMQKRQIVVSFTEDVPLACNPQAVVMVNPTQEQLQNKVNEMAL